MNRRVAAVAATTTTERRKIEQIGYHVVGSAIRVHRALGPGLLESTYQACLVFELREAGFHVDTEVVLPIEYNGRYIEAGYRIDIIVEKRVVVMKTRQLSASFRSTLRRFSHI